MTSQYQILYGDIHNHNAVGYGVGSLERAIDIARHHLDFFSFTGHSHWHDMEPMGGPLAERVPSDGRGLAGRPESDRRCEWR